MGDNSNRKGLRITLVSKHHMNRNLLQGVASNIVWGSSDAGDFKEAFAKMLDEAIKKGFDALSVMELADGKMGYTRWDRLIAP
jgi:hypothetical protein